MSTHNICFPGEIRKISILLLGVGGGGDKKHLISTCLNNSTFPGHLCDLEQSISACVT